MRRITYVCSDGQAAPVHQHSGYSPLHAHGIRLTAHTHPSNSTRPKSKHTKSYCQTPTLLHMTCGPLRLLILNLSLASYGPLVGRPMAILEKDTSPLAVARLHTVNGEKSCMTRKTMQVLGFEPCLVSHGPLIGRANLEKDNSMFAIAWLHKQWRKIFA